MTLDKTPKFLNVSILHQIPVLTLCDVFSDQYQFTAWMFHKSQKYLNEEDCKSGYICS